MGGGGGAARLFFGGGGGAAARLFFGGSGEAARLFFGGGGGSGAARRFFGAARDFFFGGGGGAARFFFGGGAAARFFFETARFDAATFFGDDAARFFDATRAVFFARLRTARAFLGRLFFGADVRLADRRRRRSTSSARARVTRFFFAGVLRRAATPESHGQTGGQHRGVRSIQRTQIQSSFIGRISSGSSSPRRRPAAPPAGTYPITSDSRVLRRSSTSVRALPKT